MAWVAQKRLGILGRLLVLEGHRHSECTAGIAARNRRVLTRRSEVGEGLAKGLLSSVALRPSTHHLEGLGWVVAEIDRLILEVGWLHGLEHELILVDSREAAHVLSLPIVEDARRVVVVVL